MKVPCVGAIVYEAMRPGRGQDSEVLKIGKAEVARFTDIVNIKCCSSVSGAVSV